MVSDLVTAPPLIWLGVSLPVVGYVALLWLLWRGSESFTLRLAAFAWGAIAAPALSMHANDALYARAPDLTPVLFAPFVEETVKAAAIALLFFVADGGVRSGVMLGGLAGLGFSMAENVGYLMMAAVQDGPAGVWRAIWLRGIVAGAKHALFTATAGAAIGWARRMPATTSRALGFAVTGFAAAVAQHALWNDVASQVITDALCNAASPGGSCAGPDAVDLLVRVPAFTVICLTPGVLALVAITRRSSFTSSPNSAVSGTVSGMLPHEPEDRPRGRGRDPA